MAINKTSVLHVYPQLNCGGTEMVIYNLIKYADKSTMRFDLLVQQEGSQDKIFQELGCQIHKVPYINKIQYQQAIKAFLQKNHYSVVHAHMHEQMHIVLKVARQIGVKHCIAHSHNARIDIPRILWPLRLFRHHKYEKYATDLFGCSKLALQWLFPLKWKKGHIIYNAIDLNTYKFRQDIRLQKRTELGISNTTKLVINVGRCTQQKNQKYIVDMADRLQHDDIIFIIIGDGPLKTELENQIKTKDLQNKVLLLGKRLDVNEWLCAADIFVFPSIYEGLGIVAIEAQTSGLRVIATDSLPEEVDMKLGNFTECSLKCTLFWDKFTKEPNLSNTDRSRISQQALLTQYTIHNVARDVQNLYSL